MNMIIFRKDLPSPTRHRGSSKTSSKSNSNHQFPGNQQQPASNQPPRCPPHHSQPSTIPFASSCVALILLTCCLLGGASNMIVQAELQKSSSSSSSSSDSSSLDEEGASRQRQQRDYQQHYQPSLIGFRCEITRDITSNGVSVIEANSPVTLTLYGESFSTNTIVAFTNEFRQPESELLDSNDIVGSQGTSTEPTKITAANGTVEWGQAPTGRPLVSTDVRAVEQAPKRKFAERRRSQSASYDCTDYNRVTSYRLTRENILSPNVVTLTVTLPELDPGAGIYYYFCIKQPKLTAESSPPINNNKSQELVWVHQGAQWWVTLKVEPPILSVTNDIILIIFLLFLSAVTSGLNLGLMSLDMNELAVISSCGDHKERSYARTIAPLRKRGNYLLCSLLLGNVMVNSTLTVILEELTSGFIAIIGSTLAIVILGEIVPQAFCARQGLAIGAKTIYLTYSFMILTFPLSYPISCLLDWVLGEETGNVYDRERLMEFIRITGHHTQLEADEVAIISGALKLKKIKVDQIMTRIEDVFMLPIDCKLDRETIKRIIEKGYSRIPVYEFGDRKQIVALILAKDLALIDPDDHTPIANMLMYCKHPLIFIEEDTPLDVALNEFKTGKSHMAVVRQIYDDGEIDKYYEAIGVVTLEDVIEEVLQVEINDETDTLSDNRRKRRRTDAQVAHLIDELTQTSSSAATTATGTCTSASCHQQLTGVAPNKVNYPTSATPAAAASSAVGKELNRTANQLTNQLTEVSISGLAQSLSQTGGNCKSPTMLSSAQPPPTTPLSVPHELSYSPSVMSQYHSIELSSSSSSFGSRRPLEASSSVGLATPNKHHHHHQQTNERNATDTTGTTNGGADANGVGGGGDGTGLLRRASQFISNMMG